MTNHIKNALDAQKEGKLEEMKQHFDKALYEKAVDLLEERKKVIAQVYFGKK